MSDLSRHGALLRFPLIGETTGYRLWVAGTRNRVYQDSFFRGDEPRGIRLLACRNEIVHEQVALRCDHPVKHVCVEAGDLSDGKGNCIGAGRIRFRLPGFLMTEEDGVFTADVLCEGAPFDFERNQTRPLWFSFSIPADQTPGVYQGRILIRSEGLRDFNLPVALEVAEAVLPDPRDYRFHLNVWQDPAAIARGHGVTCWSEDHWRLLDAYLADLARHGQKAVTTTIVHDPWGSQQGYSSASMVEWLSDGEWAPGRPFRYDFTVFDRYVRAAEKAGIAGPIHAFSLIPGPGDRRDCIVAYRDIQTGVRRHLGCMVGDITFREIWADFLPAFAAHLRDMGWFDRAHLAFDEKPADIMETAFAMAGDFAPGFKIALAADSDSSFFDKTDDFSCLIPAAADVRFLARPDARRLAKRRAEGRLTTAYVCCHPPSPNTFLFSPLAESRLLPWLAWDHGYDGFLRWAYATWPDDLWTRPKFRWPTGDMFLVYPGKEGPLASMRWEMLHQGIQDVELIRLFKDRAASVGRTEDAARALGEASALALGEREFDRARVRVMAELAKM
ncbi:MAG: glycoside hydrolase domain-containing protein [Planctomycetota bacterium]